MSTTTAPQTFSDLYTFVLNHVRGASSTTSEINKAKRLLNTGLQDLVIQQDWPWAERRAVLYTVAPYTTGTVSTDTSARTTVTGSSTAWNTDSGYGVNHVRAGGYLLFSGEDTPYRVASVASDTSLTLANNWIGSTALSGASYTYMEPEYALASDFFRLKRARQFSDVLRLPVLERDEFERRFPKNTTRGTPKVCTIVDIAPDGSTARNQRVIFAPVPNAVMQIPYTYITTNLAVTSAGAAQESLSSDDDEPIVPKRYRHVLVHYACEQWYRDLKDDTRAGEHAAKYVDLVSRMANDAGAERDKARFVLRRHSLDRFVRGGRRGRYDLNDAFDRLED